MAIESAQISTLVWLEPEQADLIREVTEKAGLRVVACGMPAASLRGRAAPEPVIAGAETFSDIRHALAETSARLVLFASGAEADPGKEGGSPLDDMGLLRGCRERDMLLVSMEPWPQTTQQAVAWVRDGPGAGDARLAEMVRVVPLLRDTPVFTAASEVLAGMDVGGGSARTVAVSARGSAPEGSLGARLFDAMVVVHALLGSPESIDAAIVQQARGGAGALEGVARGIPESLRELRGDLTANLRFAHGRAASLTLSSRAGHWFRGVTVLSDAGCLRIDEQDFEHTDPRGPASGASRGGGGGSVHATGADALAASLRRLVDSRGAISAPLHSPAVLAMCEAAVLSARTGQTASPATVLRMAGAG